MQLQLKLRTSMKLFQSFYLIKHIEECDPILTLEYSLKTLYLASWYLSNNIYMTMLVKYNFVNLRKKLDQFLKTMQRCIHKYRCNRSSYNFTDPSLSQCFYATLSEHYFS